MWKPTQMIRSIVSHVGDILRYVRIIYLRSAGVSIGKNTFISLRAKLDAHRENIIIGDGCDITYGCVILSHDASARRTRPNHSGQQGTVRLGKNVFIGVNSVVLRNVTIGDNSIIGAGSVVTRDIPPNVVAAGNPARIIRTLSQHQNPLRNSAIRRTTSHRKSAC